MGPTTRRRLLLGGAALGLYAAAVPAAGIPLNERDTHLLALGAQLDRLVRRVRARGNQTAWARWSCAVTGCAELCERIVKEPAGSLAGIAVKHRALVWQLAEDDVILDRAVRRQVVTFGR
jgi:hypothetical protein